MGLDDARLTAALEAWHRDQGAALDMHDSSRPPTSMGHQRLGTARRFRYHTSFVVAPGPRDEIDEQLAGTLERCLERLSEDTRLALRGSLSRHTPPKATKAPAGCQSLDYHLVVEAQV